MALTFVMTALVGLVLIACPTEDDGDTTAPTLVTTGDTAPSIDGAALTLTFSAALADLPTSPAAREAFAVQSGPTGSLTDNGVTAMAFAMENGTDVKTTIVLTLADAVLSSDMVTVAYTQPTTDANRIKDTAGTALASFVATAVTNTNAGMAPTLVTTGDTAPSIDGNMLTLTFSAALADLPTSPAAREAFAVQSGPTGSLTDNGVTAMAFAMENGTDVKTTIVLTLADAVLSTDMVMVAYTQPTTDADRIKDIAGTALASFVATAVTNTTAGMAPTAAPANVMLKTAGGGNLRVIWDAVTADPPVTAYEVKYGTDRTTLDQTLTPDPTDSPTTISGLTNDIAYFVTVAARNSVGTGPASAPISATPEASALVSVSATDDEATEGSGSDTGTFTVTLTGDATTAPVTVPITLSIRDGFNPVHADYTIAGDMLTGSGGSRTLTIPAGTSMVALTVTAAEDDDDADSERLTLTLGDGIVGGGSDIAVSRSSVEAEQSDAMTLVDNDNREASFGASAIGVVEGASSAPITIMLSIAAATAGTIAIEAPGSDSDYLIGPTDGGAAYTATGVGDARQYMIPFTMGATEVIFEVRAPVVDDVTDAGTATLAIGRGGDYLPTATGGEATLTIDRLPLVSLDNVSIISFGSTRGLFLTFSIEGNVPSGGLVFRIMTSRFGSVFQWSADPGSPPLIISPCVMPDNIANFCNIQSTNPGGFHFTSTNPLVLFMINAIGDGQETTLSMLDSNASPPDYKVLTTEDTFIINTDTHIVGKTCTIEGATMTCVDTS